MKTQFYGAVKCLNIKMTKFQKHYLVLNLSNKICFFNVWIFGDVRKFKFCSHHPLATRRLSVEEKNTKILIS